MKQHKMLVQVLFTALLLAAGTLACAQDKPLQAADDKAEAEPSAELVVASANLPADTASDDEGSSDPAEPSAADWKTKLQVKMALLEKLGTDSLHVDVASRDGAVQLSGTVDKRETKELAETIAKSVPAVTSVRNDIVLESNLDNQDKAGVVAGEAEAELKDAILSTRVRLALVDGLGSDGFSIGTEVASGVVTLEFEPEMTTARRDEATEAATGVQGVTKVISVEKT